LEVVDIMALLVTQADIDAVRKSKIILMKMKVPMKIMITWRRMIIAGGVEMTMKNMIIMMMRMMIAGGVETTKNMIMMMWIMIAGGLGMTMMNMIMMMLMIILGGVEMMNASCVWMDTALMKCPQKLGRGKCSRIGSTELFHHWVLPFLLYPA